ncbi:MspA family porin [Gordonia asplenii]|nr:MspA family porin [Gordonia asplenii]
MTRKSLLARAGLLGAALLMTVGAGTGAALAQPLAGGSVSRTLDDGTVVSVRLFGESVSLRGSSVAGVPTTREGWVSGKVAVTVRGKSVQYTAVSPGYDVGCQVNFSGGGVDAGVAQDTTPSTTTSVGGALTLGPGRASWVPVITTTSGDSTAYKYYAVNSYTFTGSQGAVTYSQQPFRLNGCAGYASARARVIVEVETAAAKTWVVLIGKAFSLN